MDKLQIATLLRNQTSNKGITLPEDIDFEIEKNTLRVYLSDKGITENMQNDNSAFEGWVICIKYWLRDFINSVVIDWNKELSNKNEHFHRFLYRLYKFEQQYPWVLESKWSFSDYIGTINNWVLNSPTREANVIAIGDEAILEREYLDAHRTNYDAMGQQLPIGVFLSQVSKDTTIMPRGSAQIDLWAISGETLYVFELKKEDNTKVGIISELMFYSNIMADLMTHNINYPANAKDVRFRNFEALYQAYYDQSIKRISACFLANKLHPLINNGVIEFVKLHHKVYQFI